MRQTKFILIFVVFACILLTFYFICEERADKANAYITQEQEQEREREKALAQIDTEHSIYIPPNYINGFEVYKTIDTKKDFTDHAKNVMLEYFANSQNTTIEKYLQNNGRVYGFEFDLNDDGKNEIIGFQTYECESGACTGQIIQKQNGKWKDIGYIEFAPRSTLDILQNKTNGYRDIRTLSGKYCGGDFEYGCYSEIKNFKEGGYSFTVRADEIIN